MKNKTSYKIKRATLLIVTLILSALLSSCSNTASVSQVEKPTKIKSESIKINENIETKESIENNQTVIDAEITEVEVEKIEEATSPVTDEENNQLGQNDNTSAIVDAETNVQNASEIATPATNPVVETSLIETTSVDDSSSDIVPIVPIISEEKMNQTSTGNGKVSLSVGSEH